MTTYVYGKAEAYDETEWLGWTTDHNAAVAEAESHKARYTIGEIMILNDDGTITFDYFRRVPEPYTGPTVRAKVSYMDEDGCCHRIPIDCARPASWHGLDEDHLWRVVATSVMANDNDEPAEFSTCRCGTWQEIEGEPNAVAEMVAKHPVKDA